MLIPPSEIVEVTSKYDAISTGSKLSKIADDLRESISGIEISKNNIEGCWAERAAFLFMVTRNPEQSMWNTYYGPMLSGTSNNGDVWSDPNIHDANAETISYWTMRSEKSKNPSMKARYADLVWDFSKILTGKKPNRDTAILVIDNTLSSLETNTNDFHRNINTSLDRALFLALSIGDEERAVKCAQRTIKYLLSDPCIGNLCFLFDSILLHKNRRELLDNYQDIFIDAFDRFRSGTQPGENDISPHGAENLGNHIADYFKQLGQDEDRFMVFLEIAQLFERRANIGDAFSGLHFRQIAKKYYLLAKDRDSANRMDKESAAKSADAKSELRQVSHKFEISREEIETFQNCFIENGPQNGFLLWIKYFIPNQRKILEQKKKMDSEYPIQGLIGSTIIGNQGLVAQVDDIRGDPEGPMIWETTRTFRLNAPWMNWGLSSLLKNGMSKEDIATFILSSPLFDDDCKNFVHIGLDSYFSENHTTSIHVLIPQIERALRNSLVALGKSPVKSHQTGKGINQFKSMNDILIDDDVRGLLTPDVCIYLLAALAHPKGLNARNAVCHGLWNSDSFNKGTNQLVMHCLLTLAMIRYNEEVEPTGL